MVDESKYSGNLEPLTICMFNVEDLFCTVRLEAVNFGHLALVFMVAYALFASRKKMFVFLLVFFFPSSCAALCFFFLHPVCHGGLKISNRPWGKDCSFC